MKLHRAFSLVCRRSSPIALRVAIGTLFCLVIVFLLLYMLLDFVRTSEQLRRMEERMYEWRSRSTIDLPGCRIPYINPDDEIIRQDWFYTFPTPCPLQREYFLSTELRGNRSCLVLRKDILQKVYGAYPHEVECNVYSVKATFDKTPWINGYTFSHIGGQLNFTECFEIPHIWVTCRLPNDRVYEQLVFVSIDLPPKTRMVRNASAQISNSEVNEEKKQSPPPTEKSEKPMNVLVLGVDAVSRPMFHRNMKRTRTIIEKIYGKNAFELLAFNKVGANSAPNQIPMLTGKRFRHEMDMNHGEYFDDFGNFIWNNFSDSGYTTFFAEEQMTYGLFNFPRRKGFRQKPTDYWPRPLTLARDAFRRRTKESSSCLGGEHISNTLLRYWIQVQQISTSPTFSYIWLSEATHDSVTGSLEADEITLKFFKQFERAGLVNKTIVFLIADHGYRIGSYRESPLGALEDMLPFGYILLPESFRSSHAEDVVNLEINRQRLTTPYDIHATLLDLASRPLGERVKTTALGQSLLSSQISPERTCESAGIDPQYCACYVQKNVHIYSYLVPADDLAQETISVVNRILVENNITHKCLAFNKPKVTRIVALGLLKSEQPFKFLKVSVGTDISVVKFESIFEKVNGTYTLLGFPERLDRYDFYSHCVGNAFYEKFCYCR